MATFDRRRTQGPEASYSPAYDTSDEPEAGPSKRVGRADDEARPIFLKTGLISQANGSGYIEAGGVKIACSVYGPRPKLPPYSPLGTLNVEIKFAPFASHPRRAPMRDTEPAPLSHLLSQHLQPIIHLYLLPKSTLDIHLLILQSDTLPNVLSASLTVATAALADAGIPMSALGIGAVASLEDGGKTVIDPEEGEVGEGGGVIGLGVMPALGKITGFWMTGEVEVEEVCQLIDKAVEGSRATHTVLAHALLEGMETSSASDITA